jgi:hypothetical protein
MKKNASDVIKQIEYDLYFLLANGPRNLRKVCIEVSDAYKTIIIENLYS